MTVAATVVLPTHDHAATLPFAIASALEQTVADLELLVVGDGVGDDTREVVGAWRRDSRIRFFDFEKGPRLGETWRHRVLAEARGDVVCYLCDDDLWLPDHLEAMLELLEGADFANTLPVYCDRRGEVRSFPVDLARPFYRRLLLSGENRVPLTFAGHTLEMYRRLPEGWRITPPGVFTDLFMWQQFLAVDDCRAASGRRPTGIHFPSPQRTDRSAGERAGELERWRRRLEAPDARVRLLEALFEDARAGGLRLEVERAEIEDEYRKLESWARSLENAHRDLAAIRHELEDRLHAIGRTATWRLRERLVRIRPLRWVARALAGAGEP